MRTYTKTTIGAAILLLLFLASYLYPLYGPEDFNKKILITDAEGNYIGRAPFPPSSEHILGTDRNGQDMHLLLLNGAKYTLITAFVVAILRVVFGGIIGVFLALYTPYLKKYFKDFFVIFRYIPSTFLGIVLMMPAMGMFEKPSASIVSYQILMLVFMGFPAVTIFAAEITDELVKSSFVKSSLLMGASKFHLIRTHLLPYFHSYGILFTFQQLLSTLQVTMHLGIFGIYLGGLSVGGVFGYDEPPKPASISNEWAGLIGQNFNDFMKAPWVIFGPILGFLVVIVIVNMMKKELEENMNGTLNLKKKKVKQEASFPSSSLPEKSGFVFVSKEQLQQGYSNVGQMGKLGHGKPFFSRKEWIGGLAVILLAVVIFNDKGERTTDKKSAPANNKITSNLVNAEEASIPESKKGHAVGEEIKLPSSSLTVTKVEKSNGNSKEKPKPGNEFLIISLQIKNTGKEKLQYAPHYFDIVNRKGESFIQPLLMIDIATTLPSGELESGKSITGTLAFEMPIDEPLQLRYIPYQEMDRTIIDLQ